MLAMHRMTTDFHRSTSAQPHPGRARAILAAHPEVRRLYGRNPWTAAIAAGVLLLQTAIAAAYGVAGISWWWAALLTAVLVGAFANHCLYVVVHEATHRLIFRSESANRVVAILADCANGFPAAMGFRMFHLAHHAHQGDYANDADLPSQAEADWVGNSSLRKALWLLFFPYFQLVRLRRFQHRPVINRWTVINGACGACYVILLVATTGGMAAFYLLTSFLFSVGLHPCGARWIQEHYTLDSQQETASYYGPVNRVALNVGFHNEHHDFPVIPWNRLPELKRIAREFYEPLHSHRSYLTLLRTFIFDPRYSLHRRVLRTPAIR